MPGLHKTPRVEKIIFYAFHSTYRGITPKPACMSLRRTSTVVKTGFYIFLDTQTGLQELHRTLNIFYVFPSTKRGMHELHRASIVTKTALKVFPCTENAVTQLHKTSTMVKTTLGISLDIQTGGTSFAGPPLWRKMLSTSFLTPKLACTSLARLPQLVKTTFSVHSDIQESMHELHRIF